MEKFTKAFPSKPLPSKTAKPWALAGVVGSGNLEVLLERGGKPSNAMECHVETSIPGYKASWLAALADFAHHYPAGGTKITINDQIEVNLEDPSGYLSSTAAACARIGRQTEGRMSTPTQLTLRRIDSTNFEEAMEEIGRHHGSTIALNVRISQSAGDTFVYRSGDLEVRTDNLILRTSRDLTRIGPDWGLRGRFIVSRERQGELTVVTLDPL